MAPLAAAIATTLEMLFGISLVIGWKIGPMAAGAAALTFSFACCMMLSKGIAAPFNYPVFVFTGGALLLSAIPEYKWALDDSRG